jgi:hypothetical protein
LIDQPFTLGLSHDHSFCGVGQPSSAEGFGQIADDERRDSALLTNLDACVSGEGANLGRGEGHEVSLENLSTQSATGTDSETSIRSERTDLSSKTLCHYSLLRLFVPSV